MKLAPLCGFTGFAAAAAITQAIIRLVPITHPAAAFLIGVALSAILTVGGTVAGTWIDDRR